MTVAPGDRFGPYEIGKAIGAGGMGEVYRAKDTALDRQVAIKVLPDAFASDADRIARFECEAKTLATLNHPNIAQIYGLERSDSTTGLVMELVEGPTLADRIAEGPLPVDDALGIARQVADALEAAHGLQVVHRDLKPANIKLRPDGTVKVLDFGIAKVVDAQAISGGPSPMMTTPAMTETGVILGTAAYMSPEQARGKLVDERTDIWAFGCLLFEMLTGQPAFGGADVMLTLARVLDRETDMSSMPGTISPAVRHTIKLCLEKDPNKRIADIRDVRLALAGSFETVALRHSDDTVRARPLWRRALPVALAVIGTALVFAAVTRALWPPPPPVTRFAYDLPDGRTFRATGRPVIAVSPDGRSFVYNAQGGLYLRALDELEARLIPGTESILVTPAFSPDGQSLAYVDEQGPGLRVLKRIAVSGGAAVAIANAAGGYPMSIKWARNGTILFDADNGIVGVPSTGGEPELVIPSGDAGAAFGAELLPDGDTVLFTSTAGAGTSRIMAQSLSTGERTELIPGGSDPRYLPTGQLIYAFEDGLFAVGFDAGQLTVTGGAVPLIQGVMRTDGAISANYAVADNGTLVYLKGNIVTPRTTLAWVDREGREEVIEAPPRSYFSAQLSPDGTRIALDIREQENDIWIWDLERMTLQRLTFDPGLNTGPTWSPDGERVAFSRTLEGVEGIYWQAADGSGVPELVIDASGTPVVPSEFLPDGSGLLYTERPPRDIWMVPTDDPNAARVLLQTPANETNTSISPDGRWIAFQSDESGQVEVYVRPFPDVDTGRWQISTSGGSRPRWSRDGTELLYYIARNNGAGALMTVPIDSGTTFRAGVPELLFEGSYVAPHPGRQIFDVSPDGQRFLMIKSSGDGAGSEQAQVVVVENWLQEVQRLASPN